MRLLNVGQIRAYQAAMLVFICAHNLALKLLMSCTVSEVLFMSKIQDSVITPSWCDTSVKIQDTGVKV